MSNIIGTTRRLNAVWTLRGYIHEEETDEVTITSYSNEDQEGYDRETEVPTIELKEDNERTVEAVMIYDKHVNYHEKLAATPKEFAVRNPKYVFAYGDAE